MDGAAAGPHAFPHAVFSAPVLLAQPMKQAAHSGAEPIIPTTADVGSVAVATDKSCCCVHGPSAAMASGVDSHSAAPKRAKPRAIFNELRFVPFSWVVIKTLQNDLNMNSAFSNEPLNSLQLSKMRSSPKIGKLCKSVLYLQTERQ